MDWYPWNPEKYGRRTKHLTLEQDCIYRRLIDYYMITREPLPDSDIALANIANISLDKWLASSSIVRAFFKHKKDGFLRHEYCDMQLDAQDVKSFRRSEKARNAAVKRHTINSLNATSTAQALLGDARVDSREEIKKVSKKDSLSLFPKNQFDEFWVMFPRTRRGSKTKASAAYERALKRDSEENIFAGLKTYIASDEVSRGYAKGVAAWLNDDRWTCDYSTTPKGNGNVSTGRNLSKAERINAALDAGVAEIESGRKPPETRTLALPDPTKL